MAPTASRAGGLRRCVSMWFLAFALATAERTFELFQARDAGIRAVRNQRDPSAVVWAGYKPTTSLGWCEDL